MPTITIIGGGITGLATAYQLLRLNPELQVTVLEKEQQVAQHQTGHNSGVIHSGIYYTPGSLKAQNCIRGYHQLIDFCTEHNVPYELCGKIIVATTDDELPRLKALYERGQQNGLEGLEWLDKAAIHQREPHVNGIAGIFVPQTGIVDYKIVAQKLQEAIEQMGGKVFTGQAVTGIQNESNQIVITTTQQQYTTDLLINCAGLYSDKIAAMAGLKLDVQIIPFRGEYWLVKPEKEYLVKDLVYPVPDPAFPFLGVHFTRMAGGGLEAGPNAVLAFKREGYSRTSFQANEFIETLRWPGLHSIVKRYWRTGMGEMYRSWNKAAFTKALQKLVPEIQADDLLPGGAGVRAQACSKDGKLLDDFFIEEQDNAIHLLNAPSPAATSSLSIGLTLAEMVVGKLTK
jgi:L-2-hydroxyglutarate oxidase